jgi:hypothetical protein
VSKIELVHRYHKDQAERSKGVRAAMDAESAIAPRKKPVEKRPADSTDEEKADEEDLHYGAEWWN